MRKIFLAALLAISSSFASGWTSYAIPNNYFVEKGCSTDAGKTHLFVRFGSSTATPVLISSDSTLYAGTLEAVQNAVRHSDSLSLYTCLNSAGTEDITRQVYFYSANGTCNLTNAYSVIQGFQEKH